jgi:hypothetical protein
MAVDILMIKEDMVTRLLSDVDSIETDSNDFYNNVVKPANDLGLIFIPAIDMYSDTLINRLQIDPLEKEIQIMRKQPGVSHSKLDVLQQAVNTARNLSCYILFLGD